LREGPQNFDLEQQLRRRIDGPLTQIPCVWAVVTLAAQKLEKLAGQGVERNALIVASGAASRSRIRSDKAINLLPKPGFEAISRSPSPAPKVIRNLIRERGSYGFQRRREANQPQAGYSPSQTHSLGEQVVRDLGLPEHSPISPETDCPRTSAEPGPLRPGQDADRPPIARRPRRQPAAGLLHSGGQVREGKHPLFTSAIEIGSPAHSP
jgi:hypothetical protein